MDFEEEEEWEGRPEQRVDYPTCPPRGRDCTADCYDEREDEDYDEGGDEEDYEAKTNGRSPRDDEEAEADEDEDEDDDEEDGYSRLHCDPSIESFVAKQMVESVMGNVTTSLSPVR
jgi:hypothetical protein